MGARRSDNVFQAIAPATQATAGAASASISIPNRADGSKALRVALKVVTATEVMYFKFKSTVGEAGAAAGTSYPIQASDGWLSFMAGGAVQISTIRGGTVDVVFQVIPLED